MKITLSIAVTAVVCGIGGFYGGMRYQKSHSTVAAAPGFNQPVSGAGSQRPANINGGRMGAGTGFRPVSGEITGLSGSTVTVVDSNGTASTVKVSSSTQVSQTTTTSISKLQTGDQVMVTGSQNADGSITASRIQLNPGDMFGAGQPPTDNQ